MSVSTDPARLPEDLRAATVRVPQHVVYRVFPLETVVLNLETGKYHGLDPVGGRMFELLDGIGRLSEVAARIAEDLDHPVGEVERDLHELCGNLLQRGLIEIDAAGDNS